MEIETFRQAINVGLGRAILHLRNHSWKPYAQLIEHVCLHNTAYDAQCEGSRAQYVFEIVNLTDDPQHFAGIVAAGLLEAREHWDTEQLFDLAALFAKGGDARARETMYEKFRRQDSQQPFTGALQIVSVDGMAGLHFATEQIGEYLAAHPDRWEDDALLMESRDLMGVDPEPELRAAAASNPRIKRYLDAVDKNRELRRSGSQPERQPLSYEELKTWIVAKNGDVPRFFLFHWGRHASDEAVLRAAADLLEEKNETRLLAYLRIFHQRVFPLKPEGLVEIARAGREDTTYASIWALRHIRHASVRQLALDLMDRDPVGSEAIQLLKNNFVRGDETFIESLLGRATNDDGFHWTARSALHVFEHNQQADPLPTMLAIYEKCPCGLCRNGAVNILMDRGNIPGWMLQECHYDSNDDIREAAAKFAQLPHPTKT